MRFPNFLDESCLGADEALRESIKDSDSEETITKCVCVSIHRVSLLRQAAVSVVETNHRDSVGRTRTAKFETKQFRPLRPSLDRRRRREKTLVAYRSSFLRPTATLP